MLSQYNGAKRYQFSAPRVEKSDQSDRVTMLNSPIYELDATKSEPVGNLIGVDPKGKYKWYTQNQVIP
jgi:hypothetical protein